MTTQAMLIRAPYTIKTLYNKLPSANYTGNLAKSSLLAYSVKSYEADVFTKFCVNGWA